MSIKLMPNSILGFLQAYGISQAFEEINTAVSSESRVCLLPQRVPLNILLQENIDYFLRCDNVSSTRRVGFILCFEGRWIGLAVSLSDLNPDILSAIQNSLHKVARDKNTILKNPPLLNLFRQLYTKVNAVFLGLSSNNGDDANIVRGQFIPLLQQAYAAQGIQALFAEPPIANSPDLIFLEDLVTLLKENVFQREQITAHIINPRSTPEYEKRLFKKHQGQLIRFLKSMLQDTLASEGAESSTNLKTIMLRCVKRLSLIAEQNKIDQQTAQTDNYVLRQHYLQAKSKIYAHSTFSLEEQLIIVLNNLDVNNLLKLLHTEPTARVRFLQQGLEEFSQLLSGKIETWQDQFNQRPRYLKRQILQSGIRGMEVLYQATLVPMYANLFSTVGELLHDVLKEFNYYRMTHHVVGKSLHEVTRIMIYGLTLSDALSRQAADAFIGPYSARMAMQLSGGLFGLSCAYTLGAPIFISTASFILLNQVVHHYTQQPHLDDNTATMQANALSMLTPQTTARLISLTMLVIQLLLLKGDIRHAWAYLTGLLGSILAVYTLQPNQPQNPEENNIAFLASMGGQQLGQSLTYLALALVDTLTLKSQQREAFLNHLQGLMLMGEIEDVEVTLPAFWSDPMTWITNKNPVQASFRNQSSGFFTRVKCDIRPDSHTCEITQIGSSVPTIMG